MNIKRALAIRDDAARRLDDCYSSGKSFGSSSAALEAKRRQLLDALPATTPYWVRAYLDGYWRHVIQCAYRYHLIYGGYLDGAFRSTHSQRADYYEKHGIEPREFAESGHVQRVGHYWAHDTRLKFFPTHEES
jgi:hypothetical protein